MNILVIGGTRFFGIHMVNELLTAGYDVTIATRGKASDSFGDKVKRIFLERTKEESVREALSGTHYDVVIDKIAYCSNDIKYVMDVIDCDKYIYMSSTSVYNPKHINTVEADFDGIENELIWCDRKAFPYEQIKRQAECALWQQYPEKNWIAVRYPFAIGKDDYTKRLLFYVEHTMKSIPSLGVKAYTPYVWQCPRDVLQKDENIITIAVTNTLANMLDGTYFDYDSQKLVNIEP